MQEHAQVIRLQNSKKHMHFTEKEYDHVTSRTTPEQDDQHKRLEED